MALECSCQFAPCFNSRAREGRDLPAVMSARASSMFQFTRPRGARLRTPMETSCISAWFQFTRPRGARPGEQDDLIEIVCVSIHAPARGATPASPPSPGSSRFQFTRPRGARQTATAVFRVLGIVSIHAPARGATLSVQCRIGILWRFNSRAREGRDWPPAPEARSRPRFQFTRPRGARHWPGVNESQYATFQFTRPRGARLRNGRIEGKDEMFQFTRPRGARQQNFRQHDHHNRFQFTRPRGARPGRLSVELVTQ